MSQVNKIILSSSGGGDVLTLTGNTGGAVSPSGGGNINIVMPDAYTDGSANEVYGQGVIVGNLVANSLSVRPYIATSAQTVGDTTETLWALDIAASSSVTFWAIINCAASDYSQSLIANVNGGVVRDGTNPAQEIGVTMINPQATAGVGGDVGVDLVLAANTLTLEVSGEAGVTYNWKALIYFVANEG
jgi:hypothetical protein